MQFSNVKTAGLGLLAVVALAACETTSSRPYTPSTENVLKIQSFAADSKVNVGEFSKAEDVTENMTCRALGALEVVPGKQPVAAIKDAFQQELFMAGVYDVNSTNAISGEITQLEFTSFGTGVWKIGLNVSSPNLPEGYAVSTEYSFKTSFSAISACQNVVDAFTPAVQDLIGKVVDDAQFKALAGAQ